MNNKNNLRFTNIQQNKSWWRVNTKCCLFLFFYY